MNDKNIRNIMLVTYDPFGIPAKVKCESEITDSAGADRIFMDYLQAERDAVLSSGTFPDLRVCRYDIGNDVPGPDALHDPQRLREFIRERFPDVYKRQGSHLVRLYSGCQFATFRHSGSGCVAQADSGYPLYDLCRPRTPALFDS